MISDGNLGLKQAILDVVKNQLSNNDPPETGQTLNRLIENGFSEEEALKLIGYVVASEVFTVLKNDRSYDEQAYIAAYPLCPVDR